MLIHSTYNSADKAQKIQKKISKRLGILSSRLSGMDIHLKMVMMSAYIRSIYEYCFPPLNLAGDIGAQKAIRAEWSSAKNFLKLPAFNRDPEMMIMCIMWINRRNSKQKCKVQ